MNVRLPDILFFCLFMLLGSSLVAAPANDDCSRAFPIKNLSNWCSSPRQFTTQGATPSGIINAGCFPSSLLEPDNDVWFKFTAKATTLNVRVIGAIQGTPKGSLQYPQLAVYRGSCGMGMEEVACISDGRGYHIAETFVNSIIVGETYYIRVDARNGKTGTFQLCVNNFNPVPSPSSDCSSAVVLCDKSPFTVPSVQGFGKNGYELPPGMCVPEESSSAWYKWTCDKPGTLTFRLTPVNPADDIDFVLFYLPNGVDNCSAKVPVRCMGSGENVGSRYEMWKRCTGATGLSSRSVDVNEEGGCSEFDDNFVAALRMESGQSFALMVNNYHNTGNGFSIDFGGTGTFVGPVAHFTVSKLKIEQDKRLYIKNKSSFPGGIKDWEWNFGVGAKPQTARGAGPHSVKYSSPGTKSISLSVETSNGCKVTKVRKITVVEPPPPPPPQEPDPEPIAEENPTPPDMEIPEETLQIKPPPTVTETPPAPMPIPEEQPGPSPPVVTESEDTTQKYDYFSVEFIGTIYFQSDSFNLDEKDFEILDEVTRILKEGPDLTITVEGHTNNIPSDDYCQKLGKARADSAIDYLIGKGITSDRIRRKVLGKKKTVTKDYSLQNRRRNQRVEIKILKKK